MMEEIPIYNENINVFDNKNDHSHSEASEESIKTPNKKKRKTKAKDKEDSKHQKQVINYKYFDGLSKDDYKNGIVRIFFEWVLKSILEGDDNSQVSLRSISDSLFQSLNAGFYVEKSSDFASLFHRCFHIDIVELLKKIFPNKIPNDPIRELWKLKIQGVNFLPNNMKLKWVHYFEDLVSSGWKIEDLVKPFDEGEDDDSYFQELISGKIDPLELIETNSPSQSFTDARKKWQSLDKETVTNSVRVFNVMFPPKKNGKVKVPPGAQSSPIRQREAVSKVVDSLKNIFGGDLGFAIDCLSLDDDFKNSMDNHFDKFRPNEAQTEISKLQVQYDKLTRKIERVREIFRVNLETIYSANKTSVNEINELFTYLRKLVTSICPILAKSIVPCSKSTEYRDEKKREESSEYHKNTVTYIECKNNVLIYSKDSEKPKKKKKTKPKKKPKKQLSDQEIRRKESVKRKEELKRKNREEAKKLEMEQVNKIQEKMKEMDEFCRSRGYEEQVSEIKKRICDPKFLEYSCRLIVIGKQPKKPHRIENKLPQTVAIVSSQKDATHIVVLRDQLTDGQIKQYAKTSLPMMNKLWYNDFIQSGNEPDTKDPKYIFKETIQKVVTNTIFESTGKTVQEEEEKIDENKDDTTFVSSMIPLAPHLKKTLEVLHPYLKEDKKDVTVYLNIHSDASVFLNSGIILNNAALTVEGEYFVDEKTIHTKPRPYLIILGNEKKDVFKTYNRLNGYLIGEVIAKKINFGGRVFTIKLKFINGDNKGLWGFFCNKFGGHKRCCLCSAPFDIDNIRKNFLYHEYHKFKKKGAKENFMFFYKAHKEKWEKGKTKKEMEDLGLSSSPHFFEAIFYCFIKEGKTEEEFIDTLGDIQVGIDNLHNIRGWILHLISCLKESKRLSEKKYDSLLLEYGLTSSDCNGAKMRLLILNFESIILPSLTYDKKNQGPVTESLGKVLSIFRTIVWVAYSPEEAQKYNGIKLLLRFKCFELSLAIQELPGDLKLMDLYLHMILCHFPDFFDHTSFYITSTEILEGLFITVKRCKYSTNRQRNNIMKMIFKRFEHKDKKKIIAGNSLSKFQNIIRTENKTLENKFSGFRKVLRKLEDILIDLPEDDDHTSNSQQTRAFVECLKKNSNYHGLLVEEEGMNGKKKICLKIRNDIQNFLSTYDNIE